MRLLFCYASFLSTSACSLASVLSFSALSRTLSSVFSFSRFSDVSASSCSRLTASPSCRLFSLCCSSKLCLSCSSSAFWASKLWESNVSLRLSRHSCASCWERRWRAWRSVWTSRWSARNSARKTALGPEPSASLDAVTGLSAFCTEPECCRMKWSRLGNVMGRSSGNFTLKCLLEEKQQKEEQEWEHWHVRFFTVCQNSISFPLSLQHWGCHCYSSGGYLMLCWTSATDESHHQLMC